MSKKPETRERICERLRRDRGMPADVHCQICARGPCGHVASSMEHMAGQVPSRLFGSYINEEGEAC